MKNGSSIKVLTKMAMMAAIVFVGIYLVKIPVPNGYTHLGDCMIFLGVILLGAKRGALAGSIGAALSDLLAGYMHWILPTFVIKFLMAFVMGLFMEKIMPHAKWSWIIGAIVGGILQCIGYTVVDCVMFGIAPGLAGVPGIVMQTALGILFAGVLVGILTKSGTLQKLKEM